MNSKNITTSSNFTNVTLKHGGKLEGEEIRGQITGNSYLSWKGIPYAEPPIERLRFKAPVPHKGWSGTRDATKHGHICIQHIPGQQSHVVGDEDCLYMNVYTPKLRAKNEPYPVMVWIHGGAFTFGSGNSETFNPELFVNEDVIVVTLNYRLGVLGFLSTEDQNAQGNYGLKDILLAGEWIKNNIDIFGGDPNQITYFGESGGAMMIHDLLISPLGKGLFQRAIMQSGTSLSPLFLQDRPLEKATELAKRLNLKYKSSKELVEELLRVDATILAQNVPSWMQKEIPQGKLPLSFCPTIEPEDSLEPRLLTEHPLKTLLKNEYTKIPMLIGVNSEEGLYAVTELQNEPGLFHVLNDEPNHLLPPSWNIDPNSSTAQEYFQQIQKIYFDNKPIKNVCDYVRFISDSQWNYGPYKTTRIQVTQQTAPIFFNVFSFSGDLSNIKKKRKLMDYEGVIHGDDVPYLFPMSKYDPPILKIDNPAFKVRARMVRLWANFAKHGNPTNNLDELVDVKWPKVTENDFKYMEIGSQLNVKTDPFGDRMKLWWDMDSKFN
uniref:carboxylesterase n=1 Tax=Culicoides sonorensis TaxID=179676 RepID=A0A336MQ38_CULSO